MDLNQHLRRQIAFSRATFGPGERREGVVDHIRKELDEVLACPPTITDTWSPSRAAKEWVDVVILSLDGLTRTLIENGYGHGDAADLAVRMIVAKQEKNEQRNWPDWRTSPKDKAIEHVRVEGDLASVDH